MMEEEEIDNTMSRFLDMITQQVSEKLWMLDLGDDAEDDDNVKMEDIKYGVMASNESDIKEIESDFKEMNKSVHQSRINMKTKGMSAPMKNKTVVHKNLTELKTKSIKIKDQLAANAVKQNNGTRMKATMGIYNTTDRERNESVHSKQKYLQ